MRIKKLLGGAAAMLIMGVAASGVKADEAAVPAGIGKLLPDVKPDSVVA